MYYSVDYIEQQKESIAKKARQYERENPGCMTGMVYGTMWNAWIKRNERKLPLEYRG